MAEDKSRNPDPRYNKLAIGVCPDQWGVWFPEDPKQIPWSTALDEMAQAGFSIMETGPFGYFPTDPARLKEAMDPGLVKQAHDDDWPFGLAVAKGCSVAPPDGEPKMPGLIEALADLDKELYVITEQDMYPCDPSYPLPNAIKTREYLAECGLGVK